MRYTNVEQIPRLPRKRPVRVFLLPACAIALGTLGLAQLSGCVTVPTRSEPKPPFAVLTAREFNLPENSQKYVRVWDEHKTITGSWHWMASSPYFSEMTCSLESGAQAASCVPVAYIPGSGYE